MPLEVVLVLRLRRYGPQLYRTAIPYRGSLHDLTELGVAYRLEPYAVSQATEIISTSRVVDGQFQDRAVLVESSTRYSC